MLDNILRGTGIQGSIIMTVKNILLNLYERSKKDSYKGPEYFKAMLKILEFSPPISIKTKKLISAADNWEYNSWRPEAREVFNINNPAYMSSAKILSAVTNIPIDRLLQKIYNVQGALDASNEWWKRVAMFSGWPEYQLESKEDKEKKYDIKKLQKKSAKEGSGGRIYTPKPLITKEDVEKEKQAKLEKKYFDLNKKEQVHKLDSLGLSKSEIRDLKYEKDRVKKLLELMENED